MSVERPWLPAPPPEPEAPPDFSQHDIDRAREYLLARFRHFAGATMDRYSPVPNDEMADEMELCAPEIGGEEVRKRELYLAPRGTYKTTMVIRFIAWLVLKFPGIRITIGRAKHGEAQALLFEVKSVLLSEGVARVFGDVSERAGTWNEDQINLGGGKDPTVGTFGLDVSTTGTHVDIAFVDDIINDKNYRSDTILEQAQRVLKALVPVLDPQWGSLVVTGTRWSTRDVYGSILREIEEDEKECVQSPWRVYIRRARNKDGTLFFPGVITAKFLADTKRELRRDPRMYAAWYDNQPYDDETKLFKPEYLENAWFTADFQPEPYPCLEVYVFDEAGRDTGQRVLVPVEVTMTVDPTSTATRRSDFMGVTVVAVSAGAERADGTRGRPTWWVLIARGYRVTPSVAAERVLEWVAAFHPRTLLIESAGGDIKMTERITNGIRELGVRTTIQSYSARRDEKQGERGKVARISSLEPLFRFGEIRLQRDACDALIEEYDRWDPATNGHDDVLDALAMQNRCIVVPQVNTLEEAERQYLLSLDEDEDDLEVAADEREGRPRIARTGRSSQRLKIA